MLEHFKDENHALIEPVKSGKKRPLWSVVIPTYNCADLLKEALISVFLQDPGSQKMEIIVVDDFSTKDDPEAVVKALGKDRVKFYRQVKNVGKAHNYATGISMARGYLIHLLHGDDLVLYDFYTKMEALFQKHEHLGAAFSRSNYINSKSRIIGQTGEEKHKEGLLPNWLFKIAISQSIATPSIVVKRKVYEELGGYDNRLSNTEDWEMYVRIATYYKVGFINDILASYRIHTNNSTNQMLNNNRWIKIRNLAMQIMDSFLPESILKQIKPLRKKAQAQFYLNHIPVVIEYQQKKAYLILIIEIIRHNISLKTIYRIVYMTINYKRFINN